MSIKNPTLRRRTKELTECANDAGECQLLGYELKELGSLIASMAIHMGDLQRKIDSQAEHIKDLNEKLADHKDEPTISKMEQVEDEPQTEEHCETCRHKDKCEGATYEYKNTEWWCLAYAPIDEPQTDCAWK